MLSNKKLNPIETESFIRGRKPNISQSYFAAPKNIRLIPTHYFIMKAPNLPSFNKLNSIIRQILNLKILLII